MQSFGAIIYFVFFLSDWFIAHSNILKGLNTPYEHVRLHSHFEKPGLWGFCYSAQDCTDAHLQTVAFPLFPARHSRNFIYFPAIGTAETGPQAHQDACRTARNTPLPYNLARWAPLATLCMSHNMVQFYTSNAILTPNIKSQELWSMETNKTEKRCQDFDKCLPSVLSQFKAIIKFNLKKTK